MNQFPTMTPSTRQILLSALLAQAVWIAPALAKTVPAADAAATPKPAVEVGHLPGQKAPEFSLADANGKTHGLADYKGKWVVLEWVNYDCPFVKKHYHSGNMQALQKEIRGQGVVWLSINSSADGKQGSFRGEELKARIQQEKAVPDAYLIDADGKVGKAYQARTTPTMVLINPSGLVAYTGAIDDHASTDAEDIPKSVNHVKKAVTEALQGKAIETTSSKSYGCSVKYAN
jgi:peroxiredoxin